MYWQEIEVLVPWLSHLYSSIIADHSNSIQLFIKLYNNFQNIKILLS